MNLDEANKFWFESQEIEGVKFRLNESVRIKKDANKEHYAVVISLMSIKPASYLVEFMSSPFGDLVVSESDIESAK